MTRTGDCCTPASLGIGAPQKASKAMLRRVSYVQQRKKEDHRCCCSYVRAISFQNSKTRKRNKIDCCVNYCCFRTSSISTHLVVLDGEEHKAPGVLDEHRLGLEAPVHFLPSHVRDLQATLKLVLLALRRLEKIGWGRQQSKASFRGRYHERHALKRRGTRCYEYRATASSDRHEGFRRGGSKR